MNTSTLMAPEGAAATPTIVDRCIAVYRESHNLDKVCATVGVHKLTAFKILKFNGVLTTEERLKIGSLSGRIGASAEQEFQRLVPAARSMNDIVTSNPGFDFDVSGWRVDVKAFGPAKLKGRKSTARTWQVRLAKHSTAFDHVDVFCVFLASEAGQMVHECGYRTFLVPVELVQGRSYLKKTEGHPSVLDSLEVQPDQLAAFFTAGAA